MDGALELLARVPLGVGVLAGVGALAAFVSLVTGHVVGGGRDLRWRLEAALLATLCLAVPLAAAGYGSPRWHARPFVRVAEVVFGVAILGYTATYAWAYLGAATDEERGEIAPREPLPGQASRLQLGLLALVAVGSGVAYVAHGLGAFTVSF